MGTREGDRADGALLGDLAPPPLVWRRRQQQQQGLGHLFPDGLDAGLPRRLDSVEQSLPRGVAQRVWILQEQGLASDASLWARQTRGGAVARLRPVLSHLPVEAREGVAPFFDPPEGRTALGDPVGSAIPGPAVESSIINALADALLPVHIFEPPQSLERGPRSGLSEVCEVSGSGCRVGRRALMHLRTRCRAVS